MFFLIVERGMVYLKSKKLTRGQREAVEDVMAAAHKAFDQEIVRSMVKEDGQFTSDVRKVVAKMLNHQIREGKQYVLDECRKAYERKQERTLQSVVTKVSNIEKSLMSIKVATGTAMFEEKKSFEKDIRWNKAEEVKKVAEEKTK